VARDAAGPEIETIKTGRDVMLANYVLCSEDLEERQMAPRYFARLENRLRAFLDTA